MSTWFIRKINKKDPNLLSYYSKYGTQVCHNTLDDDYIEISMNRYEGYVMTNSQGEIGCFLLYRVLKNKTVYVSLLCSNPLYKGSNHCKTLMNYFIQECKNEGKKAISLAPVSPEAEMYYVLNFNFVEDDENFGEYILKL